MGEWTIRRFTVYKAISVVPLPKRNTETQRRNGSNCFWIEKTLSHLSLVKPCSVFVSLMPWHSQKQNRTQLHILVEILWEEPWLLYSVLDAKYSKNTVKANSNYITDQWLKDIYSKFLSIFFSDNTNWVTTVFTNQGLYFAIVKLKNDLASLTQAYDFQVEKKSHAFWGSSCTLLDWFKSWQQRLMSKTSFIFNA